MRARHIRYGLEIVLAIVLLGIGVWVLYRSAHSGRPALHGVAVENYPRMDGSTSTLPLGLLVLDRAIGVASQLPPLEHSGTHGGYVNLINGKADLILVARKPSDDELRDAAMAKVELDARPVALDAFVFMVNARNPMTSLTPDQIRDIYSGKVTNWKDLGGPTLAIRPYSRNRNSGSQELMEKLVMKDRKMLDVPDSILYGMGGPIDAIPESRGGIAYTVYYYEHFMNRKEANKVIALNGVTPTAKTIATRRYPLTTEVYVVIRKGLEADAPAVRLRDWLLTRAGQRLVAESGYVPFGSQRTPAQ